MHLAGARGGVVAARRVPPERQSLVREAFMRMHEENGATVCIACAAPRMAEALGLDGDEEADGANEVPTRPPPRAAAVVAGRKAAAIQAGEDDSNEEGDEHGGDDEGPSRGPDLSKGRRTALWKTRCALAVDPKDAEGAASPGVERRSAEVKEKLKPHPFRAGAHKLTGMTFIYDGGLWSAEAVTLIDTRGTVGLYAYDTAAHASATLRLEDRCRAFKPSFVDALEEQRRGRYEDMQALDAAATLARTCGAADDTSQLACATPTRPGAMRPPPALPLTPLTRTQGPRQRNEGGGVMGGGDEAGSSEPRTLGWDSNDGGESSGESDGDDGVTAGPIQRGRGLVVEAQRQATTAAHATRAAAALGLTRDDQAQGQAERGFEEAAKAREKKTGEADRRTAETGAGERRPDDKEPEDAETRGGEDDTGQGVGGQIRGRGETTTAGGDEATSSEGEDDETGEGEAVAMDEGEDDVDMDREDSGGGAWGGGAGSSSGWRARREMSVDVEAAVERATRTVSAAQWEQYGGEPTGVKKKGRKRGSKGSRHGKNGSQRARERRQGELSDGD